MFVFCSPVVLGLVEGQLEKNRLHRCFASFELFYTMHIIMKTHSEIQFTKELAVVEVYGTMKTRL